METEKNGDGEKRFHNVHQPGSIVLVFFALSFFLASASGDTPLAGSVCEDREAPGDCCDSVITAFILPSQEFISS